jgi:hypothetical protein
LREIDGVVELSQPRHFAEHGIGERGDSPGASNLGHY